MQNRKRLYFSAVSQPILTKFGTHIGRRNPQRFARQIFDISPLADVWAIFPKILHCGIGQLFFQNSDFRKIYVCCSQQHYEYTL